MSYVCSGKRGGGIPVRNADKLVIMPFERFLIGPQLMKILKVLKVLRVLKVLKVLKVLD